MTLNNIFTSLFEEGNFPEITPDENGIYNIMIDSIPTTIMELEQEDQVILTAEIMDYPENNPNKLMELLLEANYLFKGTSGGNFAIDKVTKKVFLQTSFISSKLTPELFVSQTEKFVNTASQWQVMAINNDKQSSTSIQKEENQTDNQNIFSSFNNLNDLWQMV